jgi:integrase
MPHGGDFWQETGLVFTNTVGGSLTPTNVRFRSFRPLLKKAGLSVIRFHDLRHTAATLLLGKGVHPKIISEVLRAFAGGCDVGPL